MELSLWGTLWANCALSTTFFTLPTLPVVSLVPSENEELSADDDNSRQDHQTQTVAIDYDCSLSQEQFDGETVECAPHNNKQIYLQKNDVEVKRKEKKSKSHQRNRYSREEYKCTICPYTCTTEKAFLRHLRSHTECEDSKELAKGQESSTPRLSCPVCGKDRSGESALKKHMLRHRDDAKNFCCDICSFKTVQLKKLIQHRRMHTGERPHLCPHCVYRAARRDNLRSHVRRVHKRDNLNCDTFSPRGMLLVASKKPSTTGSTTEQQSTVEKH